MMTEKQTLFAQVLPHRPPPYPGECVSGYLVRLAEANRFAMFWDFARDLFQRLHAVGQLPVLRWEYPIDDWGRIPVRTQLSLAELRAMTVAPWLEKFRPPLAVHPGSFQSPGQWLHDIVRSDLAVCPQCLQSAPYVRLLWRLIPTHVCLAHGCWLQESCPECGHALRVTSTSQPHLRCADCGMDLRRLPVVAASDDLVLSQTQRQADMHFLLNPTVSLVRPTSEDALRPLTFPQAIGIKFRYLRMETGLSQEQVAKRMRVADTMVGSLENGRRTPLGVYLSCLDVFSLSWSSFADLQVPSQFNVRREPTHLALRVCPDPECPNHRAPSRQVSLEEDLPASQMARFHCPTCGHHFTRKYDGRLSTTKARLSQRPIRSLITLKSQDDLDRLLELGRQGMSDLKIKTLLGWSVSTICRYWSVLGVAEEVHQAQVERRLREKQERRTAVHARVEQTVQSLIQQGEKITFARVQQELQCSRNYLSCRPSLVKFIHSMAQAHNPSVYLRTEEMLNAQLMCAFADLKASGKALSTHEVIAKGGLSAFSLVRIHPKAYAMVRQAVNEYNASLQAARRQRESVLIDESAARLAARGVRLSQAKILKEAGLSQYRLTANSALHEQLEHWIGDRISNR